MQPRYRFVDRYLERYRKLTLTTLLSSLPSREPKRYLYDLVRSYPSRSGKGLRPCLCIATCLAFGGSLHDVMKSAVALELFHNAFLVHDDVEDGSEHRRGKPTLHAEEGVAIAVNVGDAMNVLSISFLMANLANLGPDITWKVFLEIEHMVRQSVEGQAMELGWVRDNPSTLNEDNYLRMTLKKTCWYTSIHPCRIGALIATKDSVNLDGFNRFGYYMGVAFQIQDDLLNLVGSEEKYGKEIGGDILEGKRTLFLIHVLANATESERERLLNFLSKTRLSRKKEDVQRVYSLMEKYGSIQYGRSLARQLAGAALREFYVAFRDAPTSTDKQFIQEVVIYMIDREI